MPPRGRLARVDFSVFADTARLRDRLTGGTHVGQVKLDPNKLFSYGIPVSTVIDRVRDSTNEVGGNVLEMNGAEYMVRGLGYLRSLADLENVPVTSKNGTPIMIKDLGTVSFGPDIRQGVAEWNGEGETVGGIVVMRDGMNAVNVIDGVKRKLEQVKRSLPPGLEIVSGYDRGGLISESINTLKHSLIEEAVIVSLVIIVFLFHFRSALIPILTLPIALAISFIPMYYLNVSSNIMSLGGLALAVPLWSFVFGSRHANFWARMTVGAGSLGLYALGSRPELRRELPKREELLSGLASAAGLYCIVQIGDRMSSRIMPSGHADIAEAGIALGAACNTQRLTAIGRQATIDISVHCPGLKCTQNL